ncbi:MAG: hypothetical protein IPK69_03095 [Phycisphaerales bacterium]|nr:MAG: hypothetical protein IPK69_03095 [Phycisphaerales bacterium]
MTPAQDQHDATSRLIWPVVGLLVILALLPIRWTAWAASTRAILEPMVAPAMWPFTKIAHVLRPPPGRETSEQLRQAEEEAARWQARALQLELERDNLLKVLEDAKFFSGLDAGLNVRSIRASVYGSALDVPGGGLRVRAGTTLGVDRDTVAVGPRLQIIGRVVELQARTCVVRPITAKSSEKIGGEVIVEIDGTKTESLRCALVAVGNNRLRGDIVDTKADASGKTLEPKVGQTVRLMDFGWPRSAQRLVLGTIVSVEPSPNQLGRVSVVVEPLVVPLDRVSEVTLRVIPRESDNAGIGGRRGTE